MDAKLNSIGHIQKSPFSFQSCFLCVFVFKVLKRTVKYFFGLIQPHKFFKLGLYFNRNMFSFVFLGVLGEYGKNLFASSPFYRPRVCLPSLTQRGRSNTRLRVRGCGWTQIGRLERKPGTLYLLWPILYRTRNICLVGDLMEQVFFLE